jgi:hypothetical protein
MSDPREPIGEPVEEPTPVADVVGQAHEGLADAEQAGRDAVDTEDPVRAAQDRADARANADADADEPAFATPGLNEAYAADRDAEAEPAPAAATTASETAAPDLDARDETDRHETARDETASDTDASNTTASDARPVVVADEHTDVVTTREDTPADASPGSDVYAGAGAAAAAAQPQPIFVQAPEEPRPRGNRGAAGAIGLLAAISFAILYLAAGLVIGLVDGSISGDSVTTWLSHEVVTWGLWVPTVVFFLAFWLLGAIINRGRWGAWVIFGLLVGVAAYGGHILGQLFEAPFWMITASEGAKVVDEQLFAPLAIAAFVIGRELTIWFGAWVARRGRRMTELNVEARREYERTLEAGPQLSR